MTDLTRGEVAKKADVNIETLRYYERRGLLPPPARNRSNYRIYPADTILRVAFVKRAQALGFSLNEIKLLLVLHASPSTRSQEVREHARQKIDEIEEKIRTLRRMKKALSRLVNECSGHEPATACPILEALASH